MQLYTYNPLERLNTFNLISSLPELGLNSLKGENKFMAFWTNAGAASARDPKRSFRFLVTLGNMTGGAQWYAKKATKPSFTVTETVHKYLNHQL